MTMPSALPGNLTAYLLCPTAPAPQTGSGPAWSNETSLDATVDFSGATVTFGEPAGAISQGLVATVDGSLVFDADRYVAKTLTYTIDAFAGTSLPNGSLLIVELGTWNGTTFAAKALISIDISPTGTDIAATTTLSDTVALGDLDLTSADVPGLTHARFRVQTPTAFSGDVALDSAVITVGTFPNPAWQPKWQDVIYKPGGTIKAARRLQSGAGRVLIVMITDSTGAHRGFGEEEGLQVALQAKGIPKWATGLVSNGSGPNGSAVGTGEQYTTTSVPDYITGAPSGWEPYSRVRQNTRQKLSLSNVGTAGGTFKLNYTGYVGNTIASQQTSSLNWNATKAQIKSALEALAGIGAGNTNVTGAADLSAGVIEVEFFGSTLSYKTVNLLTVTSSLTGSAVLTVTNVEYYTGNGQPVYYPSTVAGSSAIVPMNVRRKDGNSFAIDATMDVPTPLGLDTTKALRAHEIYLANGSSGSSRAIVRKSGDANEAQIIVVEASGGTFTVTFGASTTSALAYNISTGSLQTALQALTGASTANVYAPFTYTKRGFIVTLPGSPNSDELKLDSSSLTPTAGADWYCERISDNQWEVWTTATGGTFKLGFGGVNTASIAYNASAATVQTALRAGIDAAATVSSWQRTAYYVYFSDGASKSLFSVDGSSLTGLTEHPKSSGVYRFNDGGAGYLEYGNVQLNNSGISTNTIVRKTIDISAGTRYAPLDVAYASGSQQMVAPFLSLAQALEDPSVTSGYCLDMEIFKGGRGLRLQQESLGNFTPEWALSRLGQMYAIAQSNSADGACRVLFWIKSLVNDAIDTALSVGPSPAAGNTRAGVKDNSAAIYAGCQALASAAGVPWSQCEVMYEGSLPISPDDSALAPLRSGLKDFADTKSDVSVINAPELARDWPEVHQGMATASEPYTTPTVNDPNHHGRFMFRKTKTRAVTALLQAATGYSDNIGDNRITLGIGIGL